MRPQFLFHFAEEFSYIPLYPFILLSYYDVGLVDGFAPEEGCLGGFLLLYHQEVDLVIRVEASESLYLSLNNGGKFFDSVLVVSKSE